MKNKKKKVQSKSDVEHILCVPECRHNRQSSGEMVQCHLCQVWVHEDCAGICEPLVGLWTCDQCRVLPSLVRELVSCVKTMHEFINQLRESNAQLSSMAKEQRQELSVMARQLTILTDASVNSATGSHGWSSPTDVDGYTTVTTKPRRTSPPTQLIPAVKPTPARSAWRVNCETHTCEITIV